MVMVGHMGLEIVVASRDVKEEASGKISVEEGWARERGGGLYRPKGGNACGRERELGLGSRGCGDANLGTISN